MNNIHDYEAYNINKQGDINLKEKEENMFANQRTQDMVLKGIFLVFLSIVGNFLDTMLPCQTQKIIKQSPLIKQFLTLIVIYFVIDFSSTKMINPTEHLKNSFIIFILFNLFTKSILLFSIVSIALLSLNYIIGNYIDYNKFHNIQNQKLIEVERYVNVLIVLNIVTGFIHYAYKQMREKGKLFNWITFIVGDISCNT